MSVIPISPSTDPVDHAGQLAKAVDSARPRDTLEVDGYLQLSSLFHVNKPLHFRPRGSEGGFIVFGGMGCLTVGPELPALTGDRFLPMVSSNAGASALRAVASPALAPTVVNPNDWVFVWSDNQLAGLVPHMGGGQLPGECHHVVDTESGSILLRECLRDSMTNTPRIAVVPKLRAWEDLSWNLSIVGPRAGGRAAVFQGMPRLQLDIQTMQAGEIALQSPEADCHVRIHGQIDDQNTNGIVVGPWASNFRITGSGYGCRHVVTTSGIPVQSRGNLVRCGTPWGTVSMRVQGRYQAPLDTHAEGNGVTYEGCHIEMLPTTANRGCTGIKVRARNTTIRNCTFVASDPGQIGSVGISTWATGTTYAGCSFRGVWQRTSVNSPGTIEAAMLGP